MTEQTGTDYQRIADDIRARISSGEYRVGDAIPSTPKLIQQYGVSKTPVRQAVDLLRTEGVLIGQSGKAVYVRAMPDEAAAEMRDLKLLGETVAELKRRTEGYAELREVVYRVEDNLRALYAKQAFTYPDDEQAGGKRRDRAVGHG